MKERENRNFNKMYNNNVQTNYNDMNRARVKNYIDMNRAELRNFNEIYNNNLQTNYNDMNRSKLRNYNDISSHEKCSVWINHDNYAVAELA